MGQQMAHALSLLSTTGNVVRIFFVIFISFLFFVGQGFAGETGSYQVAQNNGQPVVTLIDGAISRFRQVLSSVELGQDKTELLSRLLPTQRGLGQHGKSPDSFYEQGKKIDIHYMRSARIPDGLATDDEFTPFVFVDDKLFAVGWRTLGGPKTRGNPNANRAANAAEAQLLIQLLGNQQQENRYLQQQQQQQQQQQLLQRQRRQEQINRSLAPKPTVNCRTNYFGNSATTTCR